MSQIPITNSLSPDGKRRFLAQILANAPRGEALSLSPEQQRLWLLRQLGSTVPTHRSIAFDVEGDVNIEWLRQSLEEVIRKHEMLRTVFVDLDGRPNRLLLTCQPELRFVDLSSRSNDQQAAVSEAAARDSQTNFDVSRGPLFRVTLLGLGKRRSIFLLTAHELICDEQSLGIIVQDCFYTYEEIAGGRVAALQPLNSTFDDFVRCQHNWLQGDASAQELAYWKSRLEGLAVVDMATDYPRPSVYTHRGAGRTSNWPPRLLENLVSFCRAQGVDHSSTILAALIAMISRYSGQDDVTVGVPVSMRPPEFRSVVGNFGSFVVIRMKAFAMLSWRDFVQQVSAAWQGALANRQLPFEILLEELQPTRDLSRTPLFQISFYQSEPRIVVTGKRLSLCERRLVPSVSLYDLAVRSTTGGDEVSIEMAFNTDLFEPSTIERLQSHLQTLLEEALANPVGAVGNLGMLTPIERKRLETGWNAAVTEYPSNACLHQLIEAQASRSPEAQALIFEGTFLSYRELNRRANQFAWYLRGAGVRAETRVGVCLERCLEIVPVLLGILKAGAAYIPLDPEYPPERLSFFMEDSGIEVLVTSKAGKDVTPKKVPRIICVDTDSAEWNCMPDINLDLPSTPEQLACVIYTSGSTGRPKGVMVPHRGIVNNLTWRQRTWPLSAGDRTLQSYSFNFDPSLWATFWPLLAGATVVLPKPAKHFESKTLVRMIADQDITVFGATPTMWSILLEEAGIGRCKSLKYVLSGGEALTAELQARFFSNLPSRVINLYGPTEATIDATFWECPRANRPAAAPIGTPIANVQVYILDERMQLVPAGVCGELHIGGVGLARGYYGLPSLTAERLVPNPFQCVPGSRLYKTGDLVRFRPDGVIEFLGRSDDQVKLRGFRIELGEIEAALQQHPAVSEVAVTVLRASQQDARLVAYVVGRESPPPQQELVSYLESRLPQYMVPRTIVYLDSMPRTSNGKIEKRALPSPDEQFALASDVANTPLEREIAQSFSSVLGINQIGLRDSFFDLGGNSLLIARLASRLSTAYGLDIAVQRIFEEPTVAGVAKVIDLYQREGLMSVRESWNIAQLQSEAILDSDIRADGLPSANYLNPGHVLVTGATGYLGSFLLAELLEKTDADIHCLVRTSNPNDQADGMYRLEKTLRQYRIWDPSKAHRIRPVPGDLARPLLGLSTERFSELSTKIDSIYHLGAVVNFLYPYSALKAPNVLGTQEVLRLACEKRLKAVHYVSTVDVLLATHAPRPFLENDALHLPAQVPDGYPRSKWVAEKIVAIARERGVPICVYRPGLIMSHTRSGATQTNDWLLLSLKGFIELGILPEEAQLIDTIPVDFAARAILHLSRQADSSGKCFHMWNHRPVPMSHTYEWIRSYGYNLDVQPFDVVRKRVASVDSSNPLYPFSPFYQREVGERVIPSAFDPKTLENIDIREECQNTISGLRDIGLECPPMSEELAHLCFDYLVGIGFLPPAAERSSQEVKAVQQSH